MALVHSQSNLLGTKAPSFSLPGIWKTPGGSFEVRSFHLSDFLTPQTQGLIVIFMCNHCPYVVAVQDRINELAKKYAPRGFPLIGISSNDPADYPDDSFENMQKRAREKDYVFPYLFDETQEVAKSFDAVCTPDPYVFERGSNGSSDLFVLRYHGRIDDSWKDPALVKKRDLADAVEALLSKKTVSETQHPSMGCSIKWKKN